MQLSINILKNHILPTDHLSFLCNDCVFYSHKGHIRIKLHPLKHFPHFNFLFQAQWHTHGLLRKYRAYQPNRNLLEISEGFTSQSDKHITVQILQTWKARNATHEFFYLATQCKNVYLTHWTNLCTSLVRELFVPVFS